MTGGTPSTTGRSEVSSERADARRVAILPAE